MLKGGYQIIDLNFENFTLNVNNPNVNIKQKIDSTAKPLLISGLVLNGVEYRDFYLTPKEGYVYTNGVYDFDFNEGLKITQQTIIVPDNKYVINAYFDVSYDDLEETSEFETTNNDGNRVDFITAIASNKDILIICNFSDGSVIKCRPIFYRNGSEAWGSINEYLYSNAGAFYYSGENTLHFWFK